MADTIKLRRGDDYVARPLDILVTLAGVPQSLTGSTIWFAIKRLPGDADGSALAMRKTPAEVVIDPDQVGAGKGKAIVTIPRAITDTWPTGLFWAEVQVKDAAGEIITAWSQRVEIEGDLVRAQA